ncbi:MAG: hypothetical protein IJH43_07130 [Mogibacterium sp.]|nr:hypothetical protein [Mogibacterium sp.]
MQRIYPAAALTLIISMLFTGICFAAGGHESKINPPVSVGITAKHEIKGIRNPEDKQYTFILSAEDKSNPMPEGASEGSMKLTVNDEKEIDFGRITFDYPGAYYYVLSQKDRPKTYRIMIAAFNDGTSDTVIWDMEDGSKTDKALFKDEYRMSPKTGDTTDMTEMILFASVAFMSFVLILIVLHRRRKEHLIWKENITRRH